MNFTILEEAVLYSALEKYCEFCESCLENPDNLDQHSFIRGDLEISKKLQEEIKADYVARGGPLDRL